MTESQLTEVNIVAPEPWGLVDEVESVHSLLGKLTAPVVEVCTKVHIHTIYMVYAKMF